MGNQQKLTVTHDELIELAKYNRCTDLARMFCVSPQRIHQLVGKKANRFRIVPCHNKIRHIPEAIFWEHIKIGGKDDCWPWLAGTTKEGYGQLHYRGKLIYAHRLAYELINGPTNLFTLHSCNNPVCCNPFHLYAGTQKQNMADREERYHKGELKRPNYGGYPRKFKSGNPKISAAP
jgi:hypothetical protein